MLNLSGVFKLISVKASGVTKTTKEKYVSLLAVDFFNQPTEEEREAGVKCQYYMLKAFGSTADFILRNFSESNGTRRAFVSGDVQLDTYKTTQKVTKTLVFDGKKGNATFDVEVERTSVAIRINDIRFLDKPNAKADTTEFVPVESGEEVYNFTVVDDNATAPAGEHTNVTADVVDPNAGMPSEEDDDILKGIKQKNK